jgi:hypothetical protein
MDGIKYLRLDLKYKWEKTNFIYPNYFLGHKYPAVYTWVLVGEDGQKSYYLGETSNLSQRVLRYLRAQPHQKTNFRIRTEMEKSKKVLLYVLNIENIALNGKKLDESELGNKYTRRGLEGLLTRELKMRKVGHIIHNR